MLLISLFGISWIGCGAEVPSEPGEEVVSKKWIDPKNQTTQILSKTQAKNKKQRKLPTSVGAIP